MNDKRCHCRTCWPNSGFFVVCSTCGNKRCPKATDHELACTGSNEAGQEGSVYGPEDKLSQRFLAAEEEERKNPTLPQWEAFGLLNWNSDGKMNGGEV